MKSNSNKKNWTWLRADRVYDCIAGILSKPLAEIKASYPARGDEFKCFREICSLMTTEDDNKPTRRRWLSQLLIELPYDYADISSVSEWKIPDAANIKAFQTIKQMKKPVDTQQKMRKDFAKYLYEHLAKEEREKFGYLLNWGVLNLPEIAQLDNTPHGFNEDIGFAEMLYALEEKFGSLYQEIEGKYDRPDDVVGISNLALTKIRVDVYLATGLVPSQDSLFAKLLLNTAINRAILEVDAQQRLMNIAKEESRRLIQFLQSKMSVLPTVHSDQDIIDNLDGIFSEKQGIVKRPIKTDRVKKDILKRSEGVLDHYILHRGNGSTEFMEAHRNIQNQFLMALAIAGSYCTKSEIDTHQEGLKHRKIEIMSGRKNEDNDDFPPEMITHHHNQYGLLYYSGQQEELSVEWLERYAGAISHKRLCRRMIFTPLLKSLTLTQISQLYDAMYDTNQAPFPVPCDR